MAQLSLYYETDLQIPQYLGQYITVGGDCLLAQMCSLASKSLQSISPLSLHGSSVVPCVTPGGRVVGGKVAPPAE